MTKIEAKIIAGSISPQGHPIATWIATFPRHILAELNTHRMLSRNSASSRAIPFKKMLERVQNDPFIPIKWMKDHTGMQGTEYFTDAEVEELQLIKHWKIAAQNAVEEALRLSNKGVSKQHINRLLEPFMWHTAIITATEIENFIALRDDPATEIHFQELAHQMLETWNSYEFKELKAGKWHMPFGDLIDKQRLYTIIEADHGVYDPIITYKESKGDFSEQSLVDKYVLKIATACCARISYGTFEGKDDYEADIKLHDRLAASGHWSPAEHCARAMNNEEYMKYAKTVPLIENHPMSTDKFNSYEDVPGRSVTSSFGADIGIEHGWCGNFRGWIQYRKLFPNENKKDPRVKQHG